DADPNIAEGLGANPFENPILGLLTAPGESKSCFYLVRKLVGGGILAVAANLHAKEPERKEFMSAQLSEEERKWRKVLVEGHPALTIARRISRYLPAPPRCKMCHNPFGGIGGKLVGLFGHKPSRKNPQLCDS